MFLWGLWIDPLYLVLFIVTLVISGAAQVYIRSTFAKWSQVTNAAGLSVSSRRQSSRWPVARADAGSPMTGSPPRARRAHPHHGGGCRPTDRARCRADRGRHRGRAGGTSDERPTLTPERRHAGDGAAHPHHDHGRPRGRLHGHATTERRGAPAPRGQRPCAGHRADGLVGSRRDLQFDVGTAGLAGVRGAHRARRGQPGPTRARRVLVAGRRRPEHRLRAARRPDLQRRQPARRRGRAPIVAACARPRTAQPAGQPPRRRRGRRGSRPRQGQRGGRRHPCGWPEADRGARASRRLLRGRRRRPHPGCRARGHRGVGRGPAG